MMNGKLVIRAAIPEDGKQIGQLIFDTVRTINCRDYNQQQVEAWVPDPFIYASFEERGAYVADLEGRIVGFGNLTMAGYLHRFYVHKDFQRQGIGLLLLEALEVRARALKLKEMTTEASITAKSFFLARGWKIQAKQIVVLRGISFINYKMSKALS